MRKYNHGKFNRRTTLTALGVGAISTFTIPPISTPRTESRSASNSDTAQGTGDRGTNDPPPEHENVAWAHIYGSSEDDDARGVVQAHGDGYVFTGHRNNSLWIVHVDSEGQTVWERTYRGEGGHDIIRTPDKGYVIVGTTGDGPLLSKVDAAGSVVWSHSLDTGSLAQAVERADEGEYILGGSIIDDDGWIANVDATGNVMWSRTFGGQKYDDFRSLATADKGGIIATGLTQSGAPDQAPWVVKVDSDGNHDWTRVLEAEQGENAGAGASIIQTRDGGYAVAGYRTTGSGIGLWTLTETGRVEWSKTYDGFMGTSLLQTANEGYVIGGSGTADIRLITTDCAGKSQFNLTYAKESIARTHDIAPARDGGFILVGEYHDSFPDDGLVVKVDAPGEA